MSHLSFQSRIHLSRRPSHWKHLLMIWSTLASQTTKQQLVLLTLMISRTTIKSVFLNTAVDPMTSKTSGWQMPQMHPSFLTLSRSSIRSTVLVSNQLVTVSSVILIQWQYMCLMIAVRFLATTHKRFQVLKLPKWTVTALSNIQQKHPVSPWIKLGKKLEDILLTLRTNAGTPWSSLSSHKRLLESNLLLTTQISIACS